MNVFIRTTFVAALLLAVVAFAAPTPAAAATAAVDPSNGVAGTTFTFTTSGYRAGERIGIWVTNPIRQITALDKLMIVADGSGNATWQWTAPDKPEKGVWRMTGQGVDSKLIATVTFTIGLPPSSSGVEPTQGGPGTTFTFTASGYNPGERTGVWLNTPQRTVIQQGQGTADENGATTWQWTAPADAPGGTWYLVIQGNDSRAVNTISFQVVAAAATPPPAGAEPGQQGVTPASGTPGTTFTFFAQGFKPREEVSYWATAPNGDVQVNNTKADADANGRIDWTWVSPNYPLYGTWTMTAFSPATRAFRRITFEITQPAGAAAADTTATVTPPVGPPGTTFVVRMGGFEPNGRFTYWVTAPDGSTSSTGKQFYSDASGVAQYEWESPANAIQGTWLMVFFSFKSDITRSIRFQIGQPQAAASEGVSPTSGTAGTVLQFFATGLPPGMLLDYFATDPNGNPEPVPPGAPGGVLPSRTVTADANGRAEWSWTIPANAVRGTWSMSIQRSPEDRTGAGDVRRLIQFGVQ